MHAAVSDLELDHLVVVHSGKHLIRLTDKITAISAVELLTSDDAIGEVLGAT